MVERSLLKSSWRASALSALAFVAGLGLPGSARADSDDQHSVDAIVAALRSPIPAEVIAQTRDLDDQLMASGRIDGANIYLVTGDRLTRANAIVRRLLVAMDQKPDDWVVRILDSNPPMVNAFVYGGKYIYVYTGLLDSAQSDDELAVVLGHELGHSLLQHMIRRNEDDSTTIAGLAVLIGQLWKKNRDGLNLFAKGLTASYSRLDEEEADALGVAIAQRAGFDPLSGVDFFSRMKRAQDDQRQKDQQALAQLRAQAQQAAAGCQRWQQFYSLPQYRNPVNYQTMFNICRDAEGRRLQFNQTLQAYDLNVRQQLILSDHPADQNRVAAVSALTDFLAGRRDLQSLANYQQSYRVMTALGMTDSVLLKPPVQPGITVAAVDTSQALRQPSAPGLVDRLAQLKQAHDSGLITAAEYEAKRAEIVGRY